MIGVNKISFLQVAILKGRIPEIAGVERAEIEVRVIEIASIGIHTTEVGVINHRTRKIAVNHFAARENRIPTEYAVKPATLKKAVIKKSIDQGGV